jgi:AraC-like DNA-binding protein
VDAVTSLLDGPRAQRAFVLQSRLTPPWSLRIEDGAPVTLLALVSGTAVVVFDDGAATNITAGDVAIVRGPLPYTIADVEGSPIQALIGPGQSCVAINSNLRELPDAGARAWGSADDAPTVMLTGTYSSESDVSTRLLEALPHIAVVESWELASPLVSLLAAEVGIDAPGQEAVLDRLLDLLLIAALRTWFARETATGWLSAYSDPIVGRAIRLMLNNLSSSWTVGSLANAVAASRALLARRFTEVVGEPPMSFLRQERLRLAADLLRSTDATLDAIASDVGYGSAFALSAAFSRERGLSPSAHRRGHSRA